MGLLAGNNVTWVSVKNGALWTWDKEAKKENKFFGVEGVIQSIYRSEDEFEGRKIGKLNVKLVDEGGEVFNLRWTEESWYTQGFFARIGSVDLSKPVIIGASGSEQNEKVTFCWMKQNDKTVQKDDTFPKPEKAEKRGKVVYDYDTMLETVDKLIEGFDAKLQPTGKNALAAKAQSEPDAKEDDEEIPF